MPLPTPLLLVAGLEGVVCLEDAACPEDVAYEDVTVLRLFITVIAFVTKFNSSLFVHLINKSATHLLI